ncbi:ABC transporter permease [[Clostridium] polysaccharolyticum]|uniref:ABC-2 family transporter protein n=1 Tax=[Clostridium] polysaccharolyticum TaxID=29364 RepID=A0A1I0DWR8_9FIRM|nr:ABC transporter permease [[Clostridium] polysaccharolyticum]SET37139.1 ABC-2 family transporter protein [[Clostridium] polysaccharolyticum]
MNVCKLTLKLIMQKRKIIMIGSAVFLVLVLLVDKNLYKEEDKIPVLLINSDEDTPLTKHFKTYMEEYVKFCKTSISDESQLMEALFYDGITCEIQIPPQFTSNYMKGKTGDIVRLQLNENEDSVLVDSLISRYLQLLGQSSREGGNLQDRLAKVDSALKQDVQRVLEKKENTDREKFVVYVNYMLYAILLIIFVWTVFVLDNLKKDGIHKHNQLIVDNPDSIYRKAIGVCIVMAMGLALVMLGVGCLIKKISFDEPAFIMIVINVINFVIFCVALSALIGLSLKSIKYIDVLAQMLVLGVSFISGVFVRQDMLPVQLQTFMKYCPTFLYVKVNNEWSKLEEIDLHAIRSFVADEGMCLCISLTFILIALTIGEKKVKMDL